MRLRNWLMIFSAIVFMAACGGDTTAEKKSTRYPPPNPDLVTINQGAEPYSLDPNLATDLASFQILTHLFEPLVRLDKDAVAQPAMAKSWEHSEDFKTWTFHLREDGRWHNGDPVTAHDFVYGLRRVMNPATASQYAMMAYNFVEGGEAFYDSEGKIDAGLGVRAIDDYTLEIKLAFPAPYFDTMVNHSIWFPLHKSTVEKFGERWIQPANYMGNGPYKMVDYRPKDRVIVQRADTHFDADKVRIKEINFLMIEDGGTEMAAFLSGTLHVTDLMPHREAPRWRNDPALRTFPMIGVYYISFNTTEPPFDDVNVRKAFAKSINRKLIVERIVGRGELPSTGFIPHQLKMPDGKDFREHAPVYFGGSYEENLVQAREALAAGGYAVDGKPGKKLPRVEYIFNRDDLHSDIAENLQFTWKNNLGVDTDLQVLEWTVLITRGANHQYQIMRSSWIGDYLDPTTFLEIFQTGHGKNTPGYSNPVYDELLSKARTETDWEKRLEYLIEAERLIVEEDCIVAPILEYAIPVLIRPELQNVVYTPLGGVDLSRAYWETKE